MLRERGYMCRKVIIMLRFYYAILCSIVVSLTPSLEISQEKTGRELKTTILNEWNTLLKKIETARWEKRIKYHSSLTSIQDVKLDRIDTIKSAFKRDVGILGWSEVTRLNQEQQPKSVKTTIWLINHQYHARLSKSKDGQAWVVTNIEKVTEQDLAKWSTERTLCPWLSVSAYIMPLHLWFQETGFVFKQVEELPNDLLKASFVFTPAKGRQLYYLSNSIKSGHIVFDRANSFRPMSYQFNITSKVEEGTAHGVLVYGEAKDGIPNLTQTIDEQRVRVEKRGTSTLIFGKTIKDFSNVEYNKDIPDEEFRLAYYGLPEPPGTEWTKPTPWYLWFGLAGILCLVFSVAMRWLKRRKLEPA